MFSKRKEQNIPMKFPKFLPDGGTIGFVAPSFGCATSPYQETFEHAQKRFIELGYRLDLGPNCYESSGVVRWLNIMPNTLPERMAASFISRTCLV